MVLGGRFQVSSFKFQVSEIHVSGFTFLGATAVSANAKGDVVDISDTACRVPTATTSPLSFPFSPPLLSVIYHPYSVICHLYSLICTLFLYSTLFLPLRQGEYHEVGRGYVFLSLFTFHFPVFLFPFISYPLRFARPNVAMGITVGTRHAVSLLPTL